MSLKAHKQKIGPLLCHGFPDVYAIWWPCYLKISIWFGMQNILWQIRHWKSISWRI